MSTSQYDSAPPTPSPAPRGGVGSLLRFARPARGKKSTTSLRGASSRASLRHLAQEEAGESEFGLSQEEGQSRSSSPSPSIDNTSQQIPMLTPPQEDGGLREASAALRKHLQEAEEGTMAAGALGQTLLEQQEHMRALMHQLDELAERENDNSMESGVLETGPDDSTVTAVQMIKLEIERKIILMKEEQRRLVDELLQASRTGSKGMSASHALPMSSTVRDLGLVTPSRPNKQATSSTSKKPRQMDAEVMQQDRLPLEREVEQTLVLELRRLQALIAERDKALATMNDTLEEAVRYKTIQEANVKKLETEKDAKDADLYEAETKEAMAREENEDLTRQLKKNEMEVKQLRKQLAEKSDAAESLKISNEDLEQKVETMQSNLATSRAKSAADQMTISGLKTQVNDLESKQRHMAGKIVPSASNLSSILSHEQSSIDSSHNGNDTAMLPDGPAGRREGMQDLVSPSASLDEAMASRLRPSEAVKSLEADVNKWKTAALKYRKKWTDSRKQSGVDAQGTGQEYDDSTDEEETAWMDEAAKAGDVRKRNVSSSKSRIMSSGSSRKLAKTMSDAFGIARHGNRISSGPGWEEEIEEEESGMPADRSFTSDDASSNAASSTRGSIDGFDPNFADPTIRSGADGKSFRRRSTFTPANALAAKGSPLARQLQLPDGSDDESDVSSHRPASVIYQTGALGDELRDLQSGMDESMHGAEASEEQYRAALSAALAEQSKVHEALLAERDVEYQASLADQQEKYEASLQQINATQHATIAEMETVHSSALFQRGDLHQKELEAVQKENADHISEQVATHGKTLAQLREKHSQTLTAREAEHEAEMGELQKRHEEKMKETTSKLAKQHEEAMTVARQRHTEALTKAREEAQRDLVAAQMEYKKLVDERQRMHENEKERLATRHEHAMKESEQGHKDHIEDIKTTHDLFHKRRDEAFGKMLSERALIIETKEKEVSLLQDRLSEVESQLAEVQRQLMAERQQRADAENRVQSLPSRMSLDTNEDYFQDAQESSQHITSPPAADEEFDQTVTSFDMIRNDTASTTDSAAVATPTHDRADAATPVVQSRTEASAQTDDDMWQKYQAVQVEAVRPLLSVLGGNRVPSPGPGGIVVVGNKQLPSNLLANASTPTSSVTHPRDSINTFGGLRDGTSRQDVASPTPSMYTVGAFTGTGNREESVRQSIESTSSVRAARAEDEERSSQRDQANEIRNQPPTMAVPPPPSMPPPERAANKSTPAVVPTVVTTGGVTSEEESNPEPTVPASVDHSPRTLKNKLRVPRGSGSRPSSRTSGPPPSAYPLRNRPSLGGRSIIASRDEVSLVRSPSGKREMDTGSIRRGNQSTRAPSAQSFASDVTSEISRMSGVSSRASDYPQQRSMLVGPGSQIVSTDPIVLAAITQTMIGDYVYKYTRKSLGRAGHSVNRHKRYFWVHPYTRTLFWTMQAPAEAVAAEATNKSAFIQDVLVVEDDNDSPPGLYHMSILVVTQTREVKFTAMTREKHDLWVTTLSYLVNRDAPSPAFERAPSEWRQSISRASMGGAAARQRSRTSGPDGTVTPGSISMRSKRPSLLSPTRSFTSIARRNASTEDVDREKTPRARGYSTGQSSTHQRRNTAAKEYLEQWENLKTFTSKPASTRVSTIAAGASTSGRRSALSMRSEVAPTVDSKDARYLSAEEMLEMDGEMNNYDGLDNVRACCNGKHDVGELDCKSNRPGSRASRTGRSTTGTSAASTGSPRKSVKASRRRSTVEDGPLKLTGAPPQLGPLNLNTIHTTRPGSGLNTAHGPAGKTSNNSNTSSGDWFSANEFGGLMSSGRETPVNSTNTVRGPAAVTDAASPNAPSFSERVKHIRTNSRQGVLMR